MKTYVLGAVLAAACAVAAAQPAAAPADYPSKPVHLLLPFSAGGGGDVLGRLLAERMGKRLNQPFVVDNKPGAAGTIGTHTVATSPADGYTITIGGMSTHTLAPATYPKLPYDPLKDFATIGRIGTSAIVMVAAKDFPANDIKEFVALAKAKPGVQYASWGPGSTGHFCGEVLAQKAGVQLTHVPFKGASQIMTDILGGHIGVGFVDMATGTPFVKEGRVKALGVCTQRSPSLPDVASYKEQGIDFDKTLSWVMYAPAGVPKPIVDKLAAALQATLKEPEVVSKLVALGITADYLSGAEQAAANAIDIPIWRKIAQDANLKLE
ncbi:Bug family tripartite tricarboxylate transporter substrate binding protein [Variovorax arabinosiphilus]|uniref:Bug family tripartite tricarboxylate transporter substrate binding protein n=1 Tax=Variovorax arabinosiphilus TaxID=3053498 RepID=UPI002578AD48|nr:MULTISPECIES: tripartite tricarboxylate transporter substrate binding protein [unclassified Variovorax]MDM0121671.1 tripartite tricarboxylate transporter substrate binding protein [Variovorax sp. J2L1-78]MDM0130732.1 tripartite tricarboxylate transporter substrate binding protein [Variovorax sp. J2L1-63]MDM0234434.1 tripartite tricarboxylate transporter substrate binding protein [Variovorax sp. J2R1-6]